jgi:hypothetical protein
MVHSEPRRERAIEIDAPATEIATTKVKSPAERGLPPTTEPQPKPRPKAPPIPKWAQRIIDEHGPEYRPTNCPKCRRKFRSYVIPQHRDAEGYICKGTMKNGVPKCPLVTPNPKPNKVYDDRAPSRSVRAIGSGLQAMVGDASVPSKVEGGRTTSSVSVEAAGTRRVACTRATPSRLSLNEARFEEGENHLSVFGRHLKEAPIVNNRARTGEISSRAHTSVNGQPMIRFGDGIGPLRLQMGPF